MRFDLTRLPVGEMLIGFLVVMTVVTFVAAFIAVSDGGGEGGEVVQGSPTPAASPTETPPAENVFEVAMVPTIQFDVEEITLPADTEVTIVADNRDDSILHNWALYESREVAESEGPSAALALTEICAAACVDEVTFTAPPPGEYFFRCDVHPIQMVGTVVVQ